MLHPVISDPLPDLHAAEHAFAAFMDALGLDLEDEHLRGTPGRVARMFATELFHPEPFVFTTFPAESDTLIVVRDIPFWSVCAHHFVAFSGVAHIGYIPDQRMVGLSKLPRALDHFSRRPQVQERLTEQVADYLMDELAPLGLGVVLSAEHLCMAMRGCQKAGARTTTSALRGVLLERREARAEFLSLVFDHA